MFGHRSANFTMMLRAGQLFAFLAAVFLGLFVPVGSADTAVKVTAPSNARPSSLLFVGNSYLYYNNSLHDHLLRMVKASGIHEEEAINIKSVTVNDGRLHYHDIAAYLEPGRLGVADSFQVVILQGHSASALSDPARDRFSRTVSEFAREIAAAGAETALYMTHAYVSPHPKHREGMIREVEELYVRVGNEVGALVIPVGLAFEESYRRRPELGLHMPYDGTHPSLLGTYLGAATVFASLYGQSPVGIPYDYFGRIDAETALYLQGVADSTVRRFYGLD